jgi:serine/threonine protein kinase
LHEQYASDKEKQERLTREARAIMTLKHPGIVGLHDFAYCNGRAYLVMDYVEGASLAELLMNGTRFSVEECLQIANQTCAALTAAHAHGIIHRDLKPANIMVLRAHEGKQIIVKLLDFGLALQQDGDSLIAKTKTGEVIGTPAYMSPEQCLGQQLDLRSDIYSLGCVLYEIMFGVKAFSAETALALMLLHINEMPAAPSQRSLDAQLSHAVEAAILKALAKKPQDRYKSAEEMYAAISKSCSGKQNSIETKLHLIRSRFTASRPDPRGLIIIALLLLFCGTFFWDHFAIVPRWVQLKQAAISQMYDERINSMTALKTLREAVDEMDRAQAPKQEIAILRSMLGDCTFVMGKTEDAVSEHTP